MIYEINYSQGLFRVHRPVVNEYLKTIMTCMLCMIMFTMKDIVGEWGINPHNYK